MEEKTVVAHKPSSAPAFRYREDFLLFGLLVRHGLCDPDDYQALVFAQQERTEPTPLMALLAETSKLDGKARADMQELLNILATPKLRGLLPQEMPEVRTLVRNMQDTHVQAASSPQRVRALADTVPIAGLAAGPSSSDITLADDGTQRLSGTDTYLSLSGTHLSQAEIDRVSHARTKSKLIGEVLAGHVLIDRLGSGGQGDVYLAKQLSLNRYVALKKLEIPQHIDPTNFIEAFRKEAQTLGQINHARIVKVYEIFTQGGSAFFTMEYLNGKTLKDLVIDAKGPLPLEIVANLACQACSALGRTAEGGLVHRDIKPANMILDENGDLKIVDFGLASAVAGLAADEHFSGTPQFASPEQVQLQVLSPLSDQYSLGLTLYFVLTGEQPIKGRKLQDVLDGQVNQNPAAPSEVNTLLPTSVDRVIGRMIAKNPADRYKSFDECFREWQQLLTESSRGKLAGVSQLLGDSLLQFGKEEKNKVAMQSGVLFGAWVLLAAGTILSEVPLRSGGLVWVLEKSGSIGTYILTFSLLCIAYVALARRHYLPIVGSLRSWLYTHITTAIIAVVLLMIHSGNFIAGITPGPPAAKPILSLLMASTLLITAISGSVGLLIFRGLRKTLQIQQLKLRGAQLSPREQMMTVLSAQLLSGWRLVHYPIAIFFIALTILHIIQTIRYDFG
jgi:predicted Ser/Thr protein kinase